MIVIKKRVEFAFLGEEYKDAYINFQSIPLSKYDEIFDKQAEGDKKLYLKFIIDTLKKYFIDGSFPDSLKLTASDIDGLDEVSAIHAFKIITGQDIDPKQETPSRTTSPTVESSQSNT